MSRSRSLFLARPLSDKPLRFAGAVRENRATTSPVGRADLVGDVARAGSASSPTRASSNNESLCREGSALQGGSSPPWYGEEDLPVCDRTPPPAAGRGDSPAADRALLAHARSASLGQASDDLEALSGSVADSQDDDVLVHARENKGRPSSEAEAAEPEDAEGGAGDASPDGGQVAFPASCSPPHQLPESGAGRALSDAARDHFPEHVKCSDIELPASAREDNAEKPLAGVGRDRSTSATSSAAHGAEGQDLGGRTAVQSFADWQVSHAHVPSPPLPCSSTMPPGEVSGRNMDREIEGRNGRGAVEVYEALHSSAFLRSMEHTRARWLQRTQGLALPDFLRVHRRAVLRNIALHGHEAGRSRRLKRRTDFIFHDSDASYVGALPATTSAGVRASLRSHNRSLRHFLSQSCRTANEIDTPNEKNLDRDVEAGRPSTSASFQRPSARDPPQGHERESRASVGRAGEDVGALAPAAVDSASPSRVDVLGTTGGERRQLGLDVRQRLLDPPERESAAGERHAIDDSSSSSAGSTSEGGHGHYRAPARATVLSSDSEDAFDDGATTRERHRSIRMRRIDTPFSEDQVKRWSTARLKAWRERHVRPEAFYYRFTDLDQKQANGEWSPEEEALWWDRYHEFRRRGWAIGEQWGVFSMRIPSRVGYQCANLYRKLILAGRVVDPSYEIGENDALKQTRPELAPTGTAPELSPEDLAIWHDSAIREEEARIEGWIAEHHPAWVSAVPALPRREPPRANRHARRQRANRRRKNTGDDLGRKHRKDRDSYRGAAKSSSDSDEDFAVAHYVRLHTPQKEKRAHVPNLPEPINAAQSMYHSARFSGASALPASAQRRQGAEQSKQRSQRSASPSPLGKHHGDNEALAARCDGTDTGRGTDPSEPARRDEHADGAANATAAADGSMAFSLPASSRSPTESRSGAHEDSESDIPRMPPRAAALYRSLKRARQRVKERDAAAAPVAPGRSYVHRAISETASETTSSSRSRGDGRGISFAVANKETTECSVSESGDETDEEQVPEAVHLADIAALARRVQTPGRSRHPGPLVRSALSAKEVADRLLRDRASDINCEYEAEPPANESGLDLSVPPSARILSRKRRSPRRIVQGAAKRRRRTVRRRPRALLRTRDSASRRTTSIDDRHGAPSVSDEEFVDGEFPQPKRRRQRRRRVDDMLRATGDAAQTRGQVSDLEQGMQAHESYSSSDSEYENFEVTDAMPLGRKLSLADAVEGAVYREDTALARAVFRPGGHAGVESSRDTNQERLEATEACVALRPLLGTMDPEIEAEETLGVLVPVLVAALAELRRTRNATRAAILQERAHAAALVIATAARSARDPSEYIVAIIREMPPLAPTSSGRACGRTAWVCAVATVWQRILRATAFAGEHERLEAARAASAALAHLDPSIRHRRRCTRAVLDMCAELAAALQAGEVFRCLRSAAAAYGEAKATEAFRQEKRSLLPGASDNIAHTHAPDVQRALALLCGAERFFDLLAVVLGSWAGSQRSTEPHQPTLLEFCGPQRLAGSWSEVATALDEAYSPENLGLLAALLPSDSARDRYRARIAVSLLRRCTHLCNAWAPRADVVERVLRVALLSLRAQDTQGADASRAAYGTRGWMAPSTAVSAMLSALQDPQSALAALCDPQRGGVPCTATEQEQATSSDIENQYSVYRKAEDDAEAALARGDVVEAVVVLAARLVHCAAAAAGEGAKQRALVSRLFPLAARANTCRERTVAATVAVSLCATGTSRDLPVVRRMLDAAAPLRSSGAVSRADSTGTSTMSSTGHSVALEAVALALSARVAGALAAVQRNAEAHAGQFVSDVVEYVGALISDFSSAPARSSLSGMFGAPSNAASLAAEGQHAARQNITAQAVTALSALAIRALSAVGVRSGSPCGPTIGGAIVGPWIGKILTPESGAIPNALRRAALETVRDILASAVKPSTSELPCGLSDNGPTGEIGRVPETAAAPLAAAAVSEDHERPAAELLSEGIAQAGAGQQLHSVAGSDAPSQANGVRAQESARAATSGASVPARTSATAVHRDSQEELDLLLGGSSSLIDDLVSGHTLRRALCSGVEQNVLPAAEEIVQVLFGGFCSQRVMLWHRLSKDSVSGALAVEVVGLSLALCVQCGRTSWRNILHKYGPQSSWLGDRSGAVQRRVPRSLLAQWLALGCEDFTATAEPYIVQIVLASALETSPAGATELARACAALPVLGKCFLAAESAALPSLPTGLGNAAAMVSRGRAGQTVADTAALAAQRARSLHAPLPPGQSVLSRSVGGAVGLAARRSGATPSSAADAAGVGPAPSTALPLPYLERLLQEFSNAYNAGDPQTRSTIELSLRILPPIMHRRLQEEAQAAAAASHAQAAPSAPGRQGDASGGSRGSVAGNLQRLRQGGTLPSSESSESYLNAVPRLYTVAGRVLRLCARMTFRNGDADVCVFSALVAHCYTRVLPGDPNAARRAPIFMARLRTLYSLPRSISALPWESNAVLHGHLEEMVREFVDNAQWASGTARDDALSAQYLAHALCYVRNSRLDAVRRHVILGSLWNRVTEAANGNFFTSRAAGASQSGAMRGPRSSAGAPEPRHAGSSALAALVTCLYTYAEPLALPLPPSLIVSELESLLPPVLAAAASAGSTSTHAGAPWLALRPAAIRLVTAFVAAAMRCDGGRSAVRLHVHAVIEAAVLDAAATIAETLGGPTHFQRQRERTRGGSARALLAAVGDRLPSDLHAAAAAPRAVTLLAAAPTAARRPNGTPAPVLAPVYARGSRSAARGSLPQRGHVPAAVTGSPSHEPVIREAVYVSLEFLSCAMYAGSTGTAAVLRVLPDIGRAVAPLVCNMSGVLRKEFQTLARALGPAGAPYVDDLARRISIEKRPAGPGTGEVAAPPASALVEYGVRDPLQTFDSSALLL